MRLIDYLIVAWLAIAVVLLVLAVLFLRVRDDSAAGLCAGLAIVVVFVAAVVGCFT